MTTSKWPALLSVFLNASSIERVSDKSSKTGCNPVTGSRRMRLRDVPQTLSPRAVSDRATARPIPELAPVRKTFFIRTAELFQFNQRLGFVPETCTKCFLVAGCRSYHGG